MARSDTVTQTPGTPSALVGGSATLPDTPNSIASAPAETVACRKTQNPHTDRSSNSIPPSTKSEAAIIRASALAFPPKRLVAHYQSNFLTGAAAMAENKRNLLTGAAAMAENKRQRDEEERIRSRQTTPNPARAAVGMLLGGQPPGMSRVHEEPSTTNPMGGPMAEIAASLTAPDIPPGESTLHTSPVSMSSLATLESTSMGAFNANGVSVASPGRVDDQTAHENTRGENASQPEEGRSNKAMTFPGPLLGAHPGDARRGMSLPHSGLASPRSPSTKKHRCQHCATDFTRQHNLKSHLLTHSHEKPYMCDTCNQRFRRLHDLKRHAKLHTGERPHVCPKCDRSFARGDALARHNKGQGGCAGRRSSMGSYGGDEKTEDRLKGPGHDESMSGLMYTGVASHEPDRMDEDSDGADPHGTSLPSIRKYEARDPHPHPHESDPPGAYQPRSPSTYPPIATRPPTGRLYPPSASHGGNPSPATTPGGPNALGPYPTTTGSGSAGFPGAGPNVFPHARITESPKPLSPGTHPDPSIRRNRSPSLTPAFSKNQFGRRAATQNTSPSVGLPPPVPGASHPKPPQLPSLPGLPLPDSRFTLHSQTPGATHMHAGTPSNLPGSSGTMGSPGFHSQVGNASANNSLSSHGTGSVTAGDHNVYGQSNERLWVYVRSLEGKIDRLQDEVASLKSQLSPSSHR